MIAINYGDYMNQLNDETKKYIKYILRSIIVRDYVNFKDKKNGKTKKTDSEFLCSPC